MSATVSGGTAAVELPKPSMLGIDPAHQMILDRWSGASIDRAVRQLARRAAAALPPLKGTPPTAAALTIPDSSVEPTPYPVVDAHIHGVDFLQHTDGFRSLVTKMRENNVTHSVIFGLPVKKRFDRAEIPPGALADARSTVPLDFHRLKELYGPSYYLSDDSKCYYYSYTDDIIEQEICDLHNTVDEQKFIPLLVGFNPTDIDAVEYIRSRFEQRPGFWKGVGEVLLRHDYLTMLTREETASIAHPAMDPIFAFCEEKRLPLLIHQNISNVTVISSSLPTEIPPASPENMRYYWELKQALDSCRHQKYHFPVVWAHMGISLGLHVKQYDLFLNTRVFPLYDNLYVDISWIVYDDVMCDLSDKDNPKVKPEWVNFCCAHSDRIMIGSDLTGHWEEAKGKPEQYYAKTIRRYHMLLGQVAEVSPQAAYNIAEGNAKKVFNFP
ncbi:amidohydrolase family protein [Pelomyxa schiedti]|nr:amidohydrolase family protein [Pelomyxa schiedti]